MTAYILTLADSLPLTQGWVRVTQLRKEIRKLILSNRIDSKEKKKGKLTQKGAVYIEKENFYSKRTPWISKKKIFIQKATVYIEK